MTRPKLFPEPREAHDDDKKPQERYEDFASKVLRVPKSEIDKREREWKREHPARD